MDTRDEAKELIESLVAWFDSPQSHLGEQSRRKVIEQLVYQHFAAIKRKEDRRVWGRDVLMYGSIITLIISLGPQLLEQIKVILK